MRFHMKFLFSILIILLVQNNVFAKNTADIFSGGTNSALSLSKANSNTYTSVLSGTIAYDHAFANGLQLGTTGKFSIQSGYKTFQLTIGPAYNFNDNDLENSFFVGLQAGVLNYSYSGLDYSSSRGVITGEFGKHFKLAEGICYSPGISVMKLFSSSQDPFISINLFKLSVLF